MDISIRRIVPAVIEEVVGLPLDKAVRLIEDRGLSSRLLKLDGRACMRVNDCRMDRIGLEISQGVVSKARMG